jgi:hypothetical protein
MRQTARRQAESAFVLLGEFHIRSRRELCNVQQVVSGCATERAGSAAPAILRKLTLRLDQESRSRSL